MIETPGLDGLMDDEGKKGFINNIPVGRIGEADEIGKAIFAYPVAPSDHARLMADKSMHLSDSDPFEFDEVLRG